MRLSIDKPSLVKALTHVASVVERRNTIPILSNVLLSAAKNELKLTATDLDIELVETVPCKAKGEGSTTVPAHMFHDIVRKLPDGSDIELTRDGEQGRLTIACGHGALFAANAAGRRLSLAQRRGSRACLLASGQGPEAPDREDAICHLDGGDPLLSQRDLSPCGEERRQSSAPCGGDRRTPVGASRASASLRRQGHARRDRAAKDRGGAWRGSRKIPTATFASSFRRRRSAFPGRAWCSPRS